MGSLFVASYDSQGYGGCVLTRLRTGYDYMSWAEFILPPTVSRPVRLGIGLSFGAHDQILFLSFL
jgi:hypothetical protein